MELAQTQTSKDPGRSWTRKTVNNLVKYKYIYALILPGMLFYLLFSYGPMYGVILAFKTYMYNMTIWESPWVGLNNFVYLFGNSGFWRAFKNTLIISFGKILICFPAPILLALLLNEIRRERYKKLVQSILYMPHFFSWVIVAGMIMSLFSSSIGAVTRVMASIGAEMPQILGNPETFRGLVFFSEMWKTAGWGTIIYLAALSGVDPTLYEAADMDGAGRFRKMWYITLPSLKYAVFILLILQVGGVMEAGFDQIFNLYSIPTYIKGDILDTYIYRMGLVSSRFEISTAVGLFKSVINCMMLLLADRITKYFGEEGLF